MMRHLALVTLLMGCFLVACGSRGKHVTPSAEMRPTTAQSSPVGGPIGTPTGTRQLTPGGTKAISHAEGFLPADLPSGEYLLILEETGRQEAPRSLNIWALSGRRMGEILSGYISSAAISLDGDLLAVREYSPNDPMHSSANYHVFSLTGPQDLPDWGEVQGSPSALQMAWRPDGAGLAIPNEWDVYYLPLGSDTPTPITQCEALLEGADCVWPSWSPSGESLVFAVSVGGPDLEGEGAYILSTRCIDTPRECTMSALGPLPEIRWLTAWSPKGNHIAGMSANDEVVVLTYPDPTVLRVVPTSHLEEGYPYPGGGIDTLVWSPDGRTLALDIGCKVHLLSIDTWELTPIPNDCRDPWIVGWIEVR